MFNVTKIPIDVGYTDTGTDAFYANVFEPGQQVIKQSDLPRVRRGKIHVTAFGNLRHVSGSVPNQERFTQPGTGSNNSDRSMRNQFADIQANDVAVLQNGNSVRNSLQVIYQMNRFQAQGSGERRFIQDPRQVRRGDGAVYHWPGDSKSAVAHWNSHLCEKLRDDCIQTPIIGAVKLLASDRRFDV